MADKIYFDLREQLDQYAGGFPSTESGIEMKILEGLFSPQEAEMFLGLSVTMETPDAVAQRLGREPNEIAARLEGMAVKGLIYKMTKGDTVKYGAVPFVPGSYDFQVKDMDRDFAEFMERYFAEALSKKAIAPHPPLRPIPVNKSIDCAWPVAPYDDVKATIGRQDKISVAPCVCRVQQGFQDKACRKPVEVCLRFGSNAHYYMALDWLWDHFAQVEPLNVEGASEKEFYVVVTSAKTGKPEYIRAEVSTLFDALKASCAMPLFYRNLVKIDGSEFMDGGIVDSIPVWEAHRRGTRRIMVIRSQLAGYNKKSFFESKCIPLLFRRRPSLRKALLERESRYNATLDFINNPPADIGVIEVCPSILHSERTTREKMKLDRDYAEGKRMGLAAIQRWGDARC